jgi:hypothetical protein
LKNLDHGKTVKSLLNSNLKLNAPAPNGGMGGLIRDFRIEDERGMPYDPRFAPAGPQSNQLNLVDRIQ